MENQFIEELSFTEAADLNGGSIIGAIGKWLLDQLNKDVVNF